MKDQSKYLYINKQPVTVWELITFNGRLLAEEQIFNYIANITEQVDDWDFNKRCADYFNALVKIGE